MAEKLTAAEKAAWDDLRLQHQDPQVHALVLLAREPLDLGDDPTEIVIPQEVLDRIAEHAATAEPGHEIGGVLVLRDGVAVSYEPLENLAEEPGRFRVRGWQQAARGDGILLHSHPWPFGATPSARDLSGTSSRRIAIFDVTRGEVHVWEIGDDRRSFRGVPVRLVDAVPHPRERRDPAVEARIAALVDEMSWNALRGRYASLTASSTATQNVPSPRRSRAEAAKPVRRGTTLTVHRRGTSSA